MPIYVAKNHNGKAIDIVLARTREMAEAYWQGKSVNANTVRAITETDLTGHPTGVMPILSTKEEMLSRWGASARPCIVVD